MSIYYISRVTTPAASLALITLDQAKAALGIDPETQRQVPPGEAGLLRVIDLANRGSCIAVQTEDVVIATGERSFVLLGRAPGAPPRGCSLTAEELLDAGGRE